MTTASNTISRRILLASGAAMGSLAMPAILRAQTKELVFWTTQRAPEQFDAYKAIFAPLEKSDGVTISIQGLQEEDLLPKLAASLAAGTAPDLISHMPPEFVMQLNEQGLLYPVDDIIKAVGETDFYENSLELLHDDKRGFYPGLAIVNSTTTGALWYRKDLVGAEGPAAFASWDKMLDTSKRTNRRGVFGTIYPFGKTSMGDKLLLQTIWRSGGFIINPDGSVGFNSPATIAAFEFVKNLVQYSPAGSASYAYTETVNGFVGGHAASAPYSGRVLINIQSQNPKLADDVSVVPFPMGPGGRDVFVGDFQSLVIPKAAKSFAQSKRMAMTLLQRDNYVRFLHVTPSHNLPNLKSVATSKEFAANPIITRYHKEVDVMIEATAKGRSLLKESPAHPTNFKAGTILGSRVMVEALQDVIIGGVTPQAAAARGADRIAELMKA
jgi:multiple sugar transport system substrate-binding protein